MKKLIYLVAILMLPIVCFASGYSLSELEEIIDEFEAIYIVKIIDTTKQEETTERGGVLTKVNTSFQIEEILKGEHENINNATYILPPYSSVDKDENRINKWLKIKGSGIETIIEKNKSYIMYFTKNGLIPHDGIFRFERVDTLDKKNEIIKLLKNLTD
ncbi:MAG: hypothetical protein ABIH08_07685 [Candidatus Omnitrophota bacterium]